MKEKLQFEGGYVGKRHSWFQKLFSLIVFTFALMGFLFLLDSITGSIFEPSLVTQSSSMPEKNSSDALGDDCSKNVVQMYGRLASMASSALVERELKKDESKFWKESYRQASVWSPCADRKDLPRAENLQRNNGYILVSANGGLNQQRVAVCNAVAVASLLNATLVIPRFLFSNVWKDPSQFGDIYQEDYFMKTLKDDVNIAKDLPPHLQSPDFKEVGSLVTDADISKEATPAEYIEKILPIVLKNGAVHFLGYGNRLGFDPLPSDIQRLRCKCNYHALKFVPKIQETGSLLIRRIRKSDAPRPKLDKQLLGNFITGSQSNRSDMDRSPFNYIALHLRFEVDMVAYSLCEFGGGQLEKTELQAYREDHFPLLMQRLKKSKHFSAERFKEFRKIVIYAPKKPVHLFFTALGFTEDLLTPYELAPFKNFSSQLAALDFIACATADVFAITDSGSQQSSLVSGFRTYYGGGRAPTLRPSKMKLAKILSENQTISWKDFEARVTNMITEAQTVRLRAWGRSIYKQPRCHECMCKFQ
ncbi:O-fucosyltransferase 8 isoform X1 [Tanacetum coccineum]